MRILISGSTGLVGGALARTLSAADLQVVRLVRTPSGAHATEIVWNPLTHEVEPRRLDGFDVVVHLAGQNIASGRWTRARRALIRDSRVDTTEFLARTLANAERPPRVFICASATGYYGNRRDEILTESSDPGKGFLPDLCKAWEGACSALSDHGVRVANLRFGVILSIHGGALARMLPIFRYGLGGVLGSGRQYMSWISLADVLAVIQRVMSDDSLSGPINVTVPNPVTNRVFTKTLGKVLNRPTILPVPSLALRLALGEMADALLLSSARVIPQKLQNASFHFAHPNLEETLQHIVNA